MMILITIFCSLTVLIFIVSLIKYLMGRDSFLKESIDNLLLMNRNKKRIYLFLIILYPFYWIKVMLNLVFMIFITFVILFSIILNVDIKIKVKEWKIDNISYNNNTILEKISIIINDLLINSYNESFNRIYLYLQKKEKIKDYKIILEHIGFIKSLGFSKRYSDLIIDFLKVYDDRKINKSFKLRIKIRTKRILSAIILVLNKNAVNEQFLSNMKIKVYNFKITTNGGLDKFIKVDLKVFAGQYHDSKRNSDPHLVIRVKDGYWSGTHSPRVKTWNKNNEIVETIPCGYDNDGKKQYALPLNFIKNYENRFIHIPHYGYTINNAYNFNNFNSFLGTHMKIKLLIENQESLYAMEISENRNKIIDLRSKKINLEYEDKVYLEKINSKEFGGIIKENLSMSELFMLQRLRYDTVEKPKKEIGYYDT